MLQITKLTEHGMQHPDGHPGNLKIYNIQHLFDSLPEILNILGPANQVNVFFTVAHHTGLGARLPARSAKSFEYQTVIPFDIDHADLPRAFEYCGVVARVLQVEPNTLILNSSGNGLQVFANLKHPIKSVKNLTELKPAYNEVCHRIGKEMVARGLPGKVDPVVFDAGRVMRLPGTINRKPNKPDTHASNLQLSHALLDLDLMKLSGLADMQRDNISPEQVKRSYPKPDFPEIVKECRFTAWAMGHPEEIHEPHFFDLVSLFSAQAPSSKAEFMGRELSAKEIAEWIFDNASISESLARGTFEDKWESASRYGARKCSTIAKNWSDECRSCPHKSKIPTPLALKSTEHIGSEDMGYWVMGTKGQYLHPNYSDLVKVYSNAHPYITTEDERMFAFRETHYLNEPNIRVKAWLETKLQPTDPLRDAHCSEFLKKIQRLGSLTDESQADLFTKSIVGKLNCKNGVLDILTGTLRPHSSSYGFQYVLPYDYIPDESSEFFLDWLAQVMQDRTELMDSILDMMAYIFWPTYDDHVFAFFTGEGANGKSTLLHIIQEIVGKSNFSAVSIQQLGSNRFASAGLEGKLVNVSGESSGYEMSTEEMNVIKTLSAGDELFVERKGLQGFTFRNKAKLIFSANKPPRFKEQGLAIQRRMLAIPFDHHFDKPDPRIEQQLILEAPKILSLIVRRIQANVKENGGRFMVHRGGVVAANNQEKLLMAGNSVIEWADERIEVAESREDYLVIQDTYASYMDWCGKTGHKPQNRINFTATINRFVLGPYIETKENRIYLGYKQVRVFRKLKWKDDL